MKKQMPKLTLSRETLRHLDQKELGDVQGGAINVTSLISECTQNTSACVSIFAC